MKKIFDRFRPMFEKGGKLERFYPLFEAKETFILTPGTVTKVGAHIRDALDTKRFMVMVIVALLPTVFMGAWNTGYQHFRALDPGADFWQCFWFGLKTILPIIVTSYIVGGLWEVLFAIVRRHEISEGFLVTGLLFPLTLPPTIPLWQVAVGISFGVVIGKEVFGGTGMNIFNPALTARAFCFFAFADKMSGERVWAAVTYTPKAIADGISGASPLLSVASAKIGTPATQVLDGFGSAHPLMDYSWSNLFIGFVPGSIGETSTFACLIGAVILLVTGIGSWRIMLSVVLGALGMSLILNFFGSQDRIAMLSLPFHWHLVMGGFAFGTVYMATDPVSSAVTDIGKYIYGALIGVFAMLIRVVNPAYPEGMMLAILFMNLFAPTIDYFVVQSDIKKRRLAHEG